MNSLTMPATRSSALTAGARRAAFGQVVLNEARLTWRRPIGLIGGVAIPLLLIIFGLLPAFKQAPATFGGQTVFDAYVPVLAAFGLAMLGMLGLPLPLVSYRELGVLHRLSTTPVPASWVLAAQAVVQLFIAVASVVAIFAVAGLLALHPNPHHPPPTFSTHATPHHPLHPNPHHPPHPYPRTVAPLTPTPSRPADHSHPPQPCAPIYQF